MNEPPANSPDIRRIVIFVLSIGLLATWGYLKFWGGESGSTTLATAAAGRIGLILAALCLAWDSLRRPAQWLPPGFAIACLIALLILAAQPRLIIVAIPALGALLALATVIRSIKR